MNDKDLARFMSHVTKTETCWLWDGHLDDGYGRFHMSGQTPRQPRAHRVAYEHFVGLIPEGLTVDHKCHDPQECPGGPTCPHRSCVNPMHMEPVTSLVNIWRGGGACVREALQTHCIHGHAFDEPNTYWFGSHRQCRACRRRRDNERNARYRAARQEVAA